MQINGSKNNATVHPVGVYASPNGIAGLRAQSWKFTDDPDSSTAAYVFSIWILLLIVISSTSFCLETLPSLSVYEKYWNYVEVVCISFFTLEFVLRFFSCPEGFIRFFHEPLNLVDLFAILPFYIELVFSGNGAGGLQVLRVVRLARVFRLFKLSKYSSGMKIFSTTIVRSARALGMLLFFVAIAMVLFSSGMYFAERGTYDAELGLWIGADGLVSPFNSIPACFWWCLVTMTTVGYGDFAPITLYGRLIAVVTMFCGLLILALPITVIGSNFALQYELAQEERQKVTAPNTPSSPDTREPSVMDTDGIARAGTKRSGLNLEEVGRQLADLFQANEVFLANHVATLVGASLLDSNAQLLEALQQRLDHSTEGGGGGGGGGDGGSGVSVGGGGGGGGDDCYHNGAGIVNNNLS